MRIARLEVAALCIGNALAYLGSSAQPIWVAALIKNGLLATSQIGWLASGELLLIAISAFAVSALGQRVSPRLVAVVAALVVVIGNAIAMLPAVESVVFGRLLSGVATGALLAAVTGVAARRRDAQRILALVMGIGLILLSGVYFVSPILIGWYGPAGLFALVAGIGVVAAVAVLVGLPDIAAGAAQITPAAGAQLAPVLGCLALASLAMGVNTLSTYIVTIGNGLGFSARAMGHVLAAVNPLAILGPVAAHILGERAGLLRPLLFGLAVIAIAFFFVVSAPSPVLLGVYVAVVGMTTGFCVPYAIALVSRVDSSGRFGGAAPAFIMIGSAAGPKLGSELIGFAHFQVLAAVAASCVGVGIVLFVALARALLRRNS